MARNPKPLRRERKKEAARLRRIDLSGMSLDDALRAIYEPAIPRSVWSPGMALFASMGTYEPDPTDHNDLDLAPAV